MIALEEVLLIAGSAFTVGLASGLVASRLARRASEGAGEPSPSATRALEPARASFSEPAPEATSGALLGSEPVSDSASDSASVPAPALLRARELARAQHEIAQHLGFDAMPDPTRPTVRKVTVDASDGAALDHLARGDVQCVVRVVLTRDGRRAALWIDLAEPLPPAA